MDTPDPQQLAATAAALEVTFDGHYYHFRQYRYEQLSDALRYARMQHDKPGFQRDGAFVPRWLPAWQPDEGQLALMRELGIVFGQGRFAFGSYRYDRLDDAVAFARRGG